MPEKQSDEKLVWIVRPEVEDLEDSVDMEPHVPPDETDLGVTLASALFEPIHAMKKHAVVEHAARQASNALRSLKTNYPQSSWLTTQEGKARQLIAFNAMLNEVDERLRKSIEANDEYLTDDKNDPTLSAEIREGVLVDAARACLQLRKLRERFGKTKAGNRYEGMFDIVLEDAEPTPEECASLLSAWIDDMGKSLTKSKMNMGAHVRRSQDIVALHDLLKKLSPQDIRIQDHRGVIEPMRILDEVRDVLMGFFFDPTNAKGTEPDRVKRLIGTFRNSAGISGPLVPPTPEQPRDDIIRVEQPWNRFFIAVRAMLHNSLLRMQEKREEELVIRKSDVEPQQ